MKENKYIRFLVFLIVNFSALAIGVWLMDDGPRTDWYLSLNKAPWTPAGWVFGVAWTTIMVLFSVYMTKVSFQYEFLNKKLLILYIDQWILNVSWNYIFFNQHLTKLGLVVITLLWLLIGYFTFEHIRKIKGYTLFILPYLIWMTIAVSLNAYIVFSN
ncbi:TspO/MBR family protein [Tenacibaculum sp.]|uniref:TspO/MBR family protein n=1 Tax=Tenacibaculum sp. TaxID=1906242 RepID=UPI003D0EFBBA